MKNFLSGFEKKAAESNYMKDFAGGVDPTGIYTFNSAKRNALAESKKHRQHKAVATAGGVAGGIAVTTPIVSGTMGAISKGMSTPGGIRARLGTAGQGFISGAQKPFKDVYHGLKGG